MFQTHISEAHKLCRLMCELHSWCSHAAEYRMIRCDLVVFSAAPALRYGWGVIDALGQYSINHLWAVSTSFLDHSKARHGFVCTNFHFNLFLTGTGGHNRRTGNSSVTPVLAQWAHVSYLSGYVEEHNDNQRMSAPLLRWLYHHSFEIWVSFTKDQQPAELSVMISMFWWCPLR